VIYGDDATERRYRLVIERAAEITSLHGHAHVDAVRRVGPVRYLRTIVDEVIASQLHLELPDRQQHALRE
jgi:hypothetical protein